MLISTSIRFLIISCFTALLAAVCFVPALGGGFVLDDDINILQNRLLYVDTFNLDDFLIAALSFHDGNGSRSLAMLSFALDYWRSGSMDARAFKITNLLIHALTTLSLAFFLRRLLTLVGWAPQRAAWGALVFSLIWAVHPLQVSSVMYVVQRMQTMVTLFIVLALWAYLAMRQVQLAGGRGRWQGVLMLLFWGLALGCKEDAVLLPLYLLVLELTVLRFRAGQPQVAKGLRQSYLLLTVLGGLAYIFVILPHYWQWEAYPGRDFSTIERLLTQARVLVMYLGQIVFPFPDRFPFLYDDLTVSRSLWQPWTTLPSLLLLLALVVWACCWRSRRPLFSFGVMLFFAGHFITSNVIGLELVFEHRNHLPLIGAVLALSDLLMMAYQRRQLNWRIAAGAAGGTVALLSLATASHAHTWGDTVRHGERLVALAPTSPRAWSQLGGAYFDMYKVSRDADYLIQAIEANELGLQHVSSPTLASNVVIYKSILGTVADNDWQQLLDILRNAPPSPQARAVIWTMMSNVGRNFDFDSLRVVEAIDVISGRFEFRSDEYLRMAVFVFKSPHPERALFYFERFVDVANPDDPAVKHIVKELSDLGYEDWAQRLQFRAEEVRTRESSASITTQVIQ
ncbi:MAG: hypothetical protein ACK4KV_23940 [Rhodocyclaceae bacterium]